MIIKTKKTKMEWGKSDWVENSIKLNENRAYFNSSQKLNIDFVFILHRKKVLYFQGFFCPDT